MKFTSKILFALLIILFAAVLSSTIILKKEYDKVDRTDLYWNYETVFQKPFKYLKISGGNGTKIAYEPSIKCSVKILQEWKDLRKGEIKAHVEKDTLYINFDYVPDNLYTKFWMRNITTVRIFSPKLLSVDAHNTMLEMFKIKQRSFHINISGRSIFEVESMIPSLDSLTITQNDSSKVVFEMSPDYKPRKSNEQVGEYKAKNGNIVSFRVNEQDIQTPEAMSINFVKANLQGYTLLDLGHAQIESLQLNIADSSAIILSGGSLKRRAGLNKE